MSASPVQQENGHTTLIARSEPEDAAVYVAQRAHMFRSPAR